MLFLVLDPTVHGCYKYNNRIRRFILVKPYWCSILCSSISLSCTASTEIFSSECIIVTLILSVPLTTQSSKLLLIVVNHGLYTYILIFLGSNGYWIRKILHHLRLSRNWLNLLYLHMMWSASQTAHVPSIETIYGEIDGGSRTSHLSWVFLSVELFPTILNGVELLIESLLM